MKAVFWAGVGTLFPFLMTITGAALEPVFCPIVGDFLYGTESEELPGRFALHSFRCRFLHPVTGQWVERESEPKEIFEPLLVRSSTAEVKA